MAIAESLQEAAAVSHGGLKGNRIIINGGSATEKNNPLFTERRRRRRRKQKKTGKPSSLSADASEAGTYDAEINEAFEVEYIPDKADIDDTLLKEFKNVLEKFSFSDSNAGTEDDANKDELASNVTTNKKGDLDSEEEEQNSQQQEKGLSNKKKKLLRRMKIAELKQVSSRPDVVEVCDATAADPKLLVFLKSYRNTVPVPEHWCQKRKFLQGKRGIRKQPFQLPGFIVATGIVKFRQAYIEKEDRKKLKEKQRERVQPKMEEMDIDYQVFYDAVFKYQTKPKLSTHGDLYHEGKEFEVKLRKTKPGMLSRELKEALGVSHGAPPPWLINMQTYGPPPSYPQLKIPGLNAPIPPGAKFGYDPAGWGRPPVDECGRPLYGDLFGVQQDQPNYEEEPVDQSKHWGDLEEEEEEQMKEEVGAGIEPIDSLSSTPTGVETPDVIDLRKQQKKEPEKPLYQVLEEREEKIAPGTLLGTNHSYKLPVQDKTAATRVDLTIQPEELEVMGNVLAAKYEKAREEKLQNQKEDFSDMVAEACYHAEKKRKRKMHEKEGKPKKDFKN